MKVAGNVTHQIDFIQVKYEVEDKVLTIELPKTVDNVAQFKEGGIVLDVSISKRIKPEPVYEYQWIYYQKLMGVWRLTDKYYVEAESTSWTKLEETKRIKDV